MHLTSSSVFSETNERRVCSALSLVVASRFVRRCSCCESSPSSSAGIIAEGPAEGTGASSVDDVAATLVIYLAPKAKPPAVTGAFPEKLQIALRLICDQIWFTFIKKLSD
jgi:hypothetical protein